MMKEALVNFDRYDRRIFWVLVGLFAVSLASYMYFLSVSVIAVVERRTAERETSKLGSTISSLESRYAELGRGIDLTLAYTLGFQDISVPTYLSDKKPESTLTFRTANDSR